MTTTTTTTDAEKIAAVEHALDRDYNEIVERIRAVVPRYLSERWDDEEWDEWVRQYRAGGRVEFGEFRVDFEE